MIYDSPTYVMCLIIVIDYICVHVIIIGFTKFGVRALTMSIHALDQIPDVQIDPEGVFKYILIRVYGKENADGIEPSKMIVCRNKWGPYHGERILHCLFFLAY